MPILIQRLFAGLTLIVLAPFIGAIAALVRATSRGPALHRADRVSPRGTFTIYKLRTMRADAPSTGPAITAGLDQRVTRLGRLLRRSKLDELPQLWNVVRGDMLLVGPRPEDPRYVDWSDDLHRQVFSARPGMTGPTALAYRNEESILTDAALDVARADGRSAATDDDLDVAYRTQVLPVKLVMDAEYLRTRSVLGDIAILGRTIGQVLRRNGAR